MSKTVSLLGFAIVAGLLAIATLSFPKSTRVMAREGTAREGINAVNHGCPSIVVAEDEGYGISRHVRVPACGE